MAENWARMVQRASFWEEAWAQEMQESLYHRHQKQGQAVLTARWNKRAASFGRHAGGSQGKKRVQTIIAWLEHQGALKEGIKVLDIGAGIGNYAVPMARLAKEVLALDPAEEMLKQLREKAREEGVNNIRTHCQTWQEVDLAARGWEHHFDLVFASLTPGVRDSTALQKMMRASKRYCYLSSFAGTREDPVQRELWQQIFHTEMPSRGGDIIFPFNLLYAWGYRPELKFLVADWVQEDSLDEAYEEMENFFAMFTEVSGELKTKIREHLHKLAPSGVLRREIKSTLGLLLWQV